MFPNCSKVKIACLQILAALFVSACGGGGGGGAGGNAILDSEWLIPTANVVDGGPGKDGIPALEKPSFESASTITTVNPSDLVGVREAGPEVRRRRSFGSGAVAGGGWSTRKPPKAP